MERTVSGVAVLDKSVRILEVLADGRRRTLGELVADTGQARATCHRLAHALQAHGLTRLGDDERWELGDRLGRLAGAMGDPELAVIAAGPLHRLVDDTGESAQLYVAREGRRVCVVAVESAQSLRTIVPIGAVLPLDLGSAGQVLSRHPRAQRRGWAESVEEREKGVASVSAPVHRGGEVVAAVSVSGPVERTSRQPGRRYAKAVIAAAAAIEAAISSR
ncbi:MAG: IclR family transcriptional regulator C-terminal domain-containing protein [Acidimicrobiales bacterium]